MIDLGENTDCRISKRPLLRPKIASKYASEREAKVVYVSSKTPFMSAVKRVQSLLGQVEKRKVQSAVGIEAHLEDRQRRQQGPFSVELVA